MADLKCVGKSIPRIDAREKVTGQAKFTADCSMPRMLVGKILRSPYPHAKIVSIDTSEAEKISGVRSVITAKDTPPVRWSVSVEDEYVLPTDGIVRKVYDPVAAVAAETEEAAEEAIELIDVQYEELPRVLTIDDGWSKNPPAILHPDRLNYTIYPPMARSYKWKPVTERPNNLQTFRIRKGNMEKGFEEADLIVENTFETVRGHHAPIETHCCLCWVDSTGIINVTSSTQTAWLDRAGLARLYRCDEEKFRMHNPWVGSGWGGKYGVKEEQPIAIELAKKTGRPVQIVLSRDECFLATECRMPIRTHIKDGYKKDGTLIAREIDMKEDIGAYAMIGAMLVKNAAFGAVGTYNIPNFKLDSSGVYTNLPRASVLRGVGTPEITWAMEQQIEIAAEKLGLDPVEIRVKNMLKRGDVDVTGQLTKSTGAKECIETVAKEIGLRGPVPKSAGPWKIGRGIAIGNKYTTAGQADCAVVKVFREGIIEVRHNSCEMGQGTHSCFAQMAAEEFNIPMERVRVVRGDTATTPYGAGSWSSRSIFHEGNAVVRACRDAKRKMFTIAAPILGISSDELETGDDRIYRKFLPSTNISWADLFVPGIPVAKEGTEIVGYGSYISPIVLEDDNGQSERMCVYYAYCAYGVEVAINIETGQVKVLSCVGAADMGQPINPAMCEGQIESGMAMGIGLGMYEEMKFSNGIPLNPTFMDYKLPTVDEIPIGDNMKSFLCGDPFEEGPFGAKGLGESTLSAIAPAISNAIYNATGIRLHNQPISRDTIWKALKASKSK